MRVRLGPCKTGLTNISLPTCTFLNRFKHPSSFILLSFKGDTSVVVLFVLCFGVEFLCCLNLLKDLRFNFYLILLQLVLCRVAALKSLPSSIVQLYFIFGPLRSARIF